MKQVAPFIGQSESIDSQLFANLANWSEGIDLNNPDIEKNNYKGWTAADFKKLLLASEVTPEQIRARLGIETPSPTPEISDIEKEIIAKGKDLKQMVPFLNRQEEVQRIFSDLVNWSEGIDLDNPDIAEHYAGWTAADFRKLLETAGLTPEQIRSRLG